MEINKKNLSEHRLERPMVVKKVIPEFDEPLFSATDNKNWPTNYEEYVDDYLTALNYLHLFTSKEEFFDFFQISDFLIEYTSTWDFDLFVGAFCYHYIVSELKTNNYVLSAYNWKKIINLMLMKECAYIIKLLIKKNDFSSFSKKQDIIEGAAQAIGSCKYLVDLEEPSILPTNAFSIGVLGDVLRFLEVGEKSTDFLVKSLYAEKNPNKIVSFLKKYEWSQRQSSAIQSGTLYLQQLSLNKKSLTLLFNDFLETKKNELESFDPFNAFFSFEENVTKIATFTLADSYLILFTDLLRNSKSDLLKIFDFFEVRIYKSKDLFQDSDKLFQNREKYYERSFKADLLKDLNLLAYVNETELYRDESVERLNIYIEEFLDEAHKFYMSDNEELGSLIDNSLLKKVKNVTVEAAIPFILISGLVAIYVSMLRQPERNSYVNFRSSSPFAMIQPFSYSSRQLSSTKQTLESSVKTTVQLPRQITTVTNETNQSKSLKLYQRSLQKHTARNLEVARRKSLIGSTKTLVPTPKRIQISQNDAFYQDANKLVEKVNTVVDKMRRNNRVVQPQLNFGKNPDGTLNGKVNVINSVGMHSSVQELREAIGKIIKTNNLKLTFVSKDQESDHFKTSTQRSGYKFVSKVDTAMAVVKTREEHLTTTNWASTTHSRLDADRKLIPELSYEGGVTPDLLIDFEDAGKFEATKSFLQARYSLSPDTGKLIMLDDNANVSGFSGEELLELEGTSGAEVVKA